MTLFPVLVDVYHKEQLVTKEEAEKVVSDIRGWEWRWAEVVITEDVVTAARIADILDEYGFHNVAQHIRSKCVYSRLYKIKIMYRIPLKRHNHLQWNLSIMHTLGP